MDILDKPVCDASAWKAQDFANMDEWVYRFTDADIAELDVAMKELKRQGLEPPSFDASQFEIPTLSLKLKKLEREFEFGRGFFVLRGLPVERYSLDEIKIMYWGIGTHIGVPSYQNKKGELISHVADAGDDYAAVNTRLYTTAAAANPHNDPCDVVGLLCVRKAKQGGLSMISSAMSIYNEILKTKPEYLPVLYRGFPHDLRGEGVTGRLDEVTDVIPVYSYFGGRLSCCINSKSAKTAREKMGNPIPPKEWEALEYFESLAVRPDMALSMELLPGDIQFLNNYVIIHTRTAFADGDDPKQKRLLLRLWLNLVAGRPLAVGFGDRFNNGCRGGVPALAKSGSMLQSNVEENVRAE